MAFSIVEIWNAGGEELCYHDLVVLWVCAYTKQVITGSLVPSAYNGFSFRSEDQPFLWLDALAKWVWLTSSFLVITVDLGVGPKSDVGFSA
jgi:hypothetical protein